MPLHSTGPPRAEDEHEAVVDVRPQFAAPQMDAVPRNRLPDGEMDGATAYQIVHDELMLDGNARLNLATFVTTWMDEHAQRLMAECTDKNMIDKDEYPQTAELERRCVAMLSRLWHAPETGAAVGCSTTGSSEACMLAGMALLRRWRARRDVAGMPAARPNLVMGANVQV
jgi:glutamate decarboxylase